MTGRAHFFARVLGQLAWILAAWMIFTADTLAANDCASSTKTEAFVDNASFTDTTFRARIEACLHRRDFGQAFDEDLVGAEGGNLDISPYQNMIRVHVNRDGSYGIPPDKYWCPAGGYGYDKYDTDGDGKPDVVSASFGFDIDRPIMMNEQMDSMQYASALLPTDAILMSWDVDGVGELETDCPGPRGNNIKSIVVENRVGGNRDTGENRPEITIEAGTSPVTEGTAATFTLSRTGLATQSLTVTVSVSESGNMIQGSAPSSVTFNSGQSTAALTVPTAADSTDENDSMITASITGGLSATYTVGTPGSAQVLVEDDDVDLPEITISANPTTVTEGTAAAFTLTRTGANAQPLTVDLNVSESEDIFSGVPPATVTFTANQPTAILSIATTDDTIDEPDGVITVRITSHASYQLGSPSSATVTVEDDDMPRVTIEAVTSPVTEGTDATFTLTRVGVVTDTLLVQLNVSENGDMISGNAPSTVSFSAGMATTTLRVPTVADTDDENDSVITAVVTSSLDMSYAIGTDDTATVTVEDDDEPGVLVVTIQAGTTPVTEGTAATFTLSRTGATTAGLTVYVAISETGEMTSEDGPQTVTIGAGDEDFTLTVNTDDDTTDEDNSDITVTITAHADYSVGSSSSATVTVEDDEWPEISIEAPTAMLYEGDDVVFTLRRTSIDDGRMSVNVTISETGVMTSQDGATTATFEVNDLQTTLTVTTQADTDVENDSTITATLNALPNEYTVSTTAGSAFATVHDDDAQGLPVVTITADRSSVIEGTDVTFTLRRTGALTSSLQVGLNITETEAMISGNAPDMATFGINMEAVTITVLTEADTVPEADSTITARVSPNTASYSVGAQAAANVIVRDNDGYTGNPVNNRRSPGGAPGAELAEVVLLAGPTPVIEGAEASFTLRRTGPRDAALTIAVKVSETGNMIQGTPPAQVSFGAGKLLALLPVPTAADRRDEPHSTITARVRAGSGYTVGKPGSATVTVQDDDERTGSSTRVNDELLPRVTQAMMSSTLSAISNRLEMAAPGGVDKRYEPEHDETSIEEVLINIPQLRPSESLNLGHLLAGKSFVLPLGADGGPWEGASLWVRGDYRNVGGGRDRPVVWDGNLTNLHMGVDLWLRPNLLAGMALSRSDGKFDYREQVESGEGDYDSELTSLHPYISWSSPDNHMHIWSTVGYGEGEVRIDEDGYSDSSDTQLMTATLGFSGRLAKVENRYAPGTSTLRLKGEGNATKIRARGGEEIETLNANFRRTRLALEGKHVLEKGDGRLLIPSVEVGFRHDRGDALTGGGFEVGTGVRYTDPNRRLAMEGRARLLIDHDDDYDEWGIMGEVRVDPTPGRHGLAFSLSPSWGLPSSSLDRLWAWDGGTGLQGVRPQMTGRLNAKLEYGLPALGGQGLWLPYADISLIEAGGLDVRLGGSLEVTRSLRLNLEGGRLVDTEDSSNYGVGLWSKMQF